MKYTKGMPMIRYIYEETLEQRPEIVKHLQAYNIVFTGVRPSEDRYFYVLENKKLVGAIKTNLGWDWVTLDNIYYQNIEILEFLFSVVCRYYKSKSSGILYHDEESNELDDFRKIGFSFEGMIDATPLCKDYYYVSNTTFDITSNLKLKIIDSKEKDETLDKIHQRKLKKNDLLKTDLIVIAKDNNEFVGGVHGVVTGDKMYVSLLVVIETYKGKKIGKKLMDMIEEKAREKGVVSVDLGTCEFQAKPFYEKQGYKVIATLKDYPKGFEEYTLVKRLDK